MHRDYSMTMMYFVRNLLRNFVNTSALNAFGYHNAQHEHWATAEIFLKTPQRASGAFQIDVQVDLQKVKSVF